MGQFTDFRSDSKRKDLHGLSYRDACLEDVHGIAQLKFQRDPSHSREEYQGRIEKELSRMEGNLHLHVAVYHKQIIGFARSAYFDTDDKKYRYPAPTGWYLMGLIVHNKYQLCGVGTALTQRRLQRLASLTNVVYYLANSHNDVSLHLHERLGFSIIDSGPGFLDIEFDGGEGVLCKKTITMGHFITDN